MNASPILAVQQVWFAYPNGDKPVLQDISFDIQPGTVNAILGPNGAGKSTLLHLILGLYPMQRGQILLADRPLHSYTRQVLSRTVGLVLQREVIPFDYRVLEYVLLGRTPHLGFLRMPHPSDVQAIWTILERLDIGDLGLRRVTALSGGEQQLTLIARALAQETPILLLDEPTSHLDLGNKRRILTLLRDLTTQDKTILFTTHDPEAALSIADHLILLRAGRLLRHGSPEEVFTTETLSQTYETPLRVREVDGQKVILLELPGNEQEKE